MTSILNRQIIVNDYEPVNLSVRALKGVALDLRVRMIDLANAPIDPTARFPQLVLFPRAGGGVRPYDMEPYDAVNGVSVARIPGSDLQDARGYNLELYLREANPVPEDPELPSQLAATGEVVLRGGAHSHVGPMSNINIPVVVGPPGPAGEQGEQGDTGAPGAPGQRGATWFTGTGDPSITGIELVPGDMYLDNSNGSVWRWEGDVWKLV